MSVHCKATHTSKHLSFDSRSPAQSKKAVVKTLMDRARCLPLNTKQRSSEEQRVVRDLKANGYPAKFFIGKVFNDLNKSNAGDEVITINLN